MNHESTRVLTPEAQHHRMLETSMPKLIASLAVPTVAMQLVSVLYNTVDTYFVSQISTSASAAVGVAFSLQSLIQAVGGGFGMGAGSLISRRLGEKKNDEADLYCVSALAGTLVFSLLLMIFGLLFLEPLMLLLGSTESMLPHACAYARFVLLAAPVHCCAFVLNNTLRSEGEANYSMYGMCSGTLLNVALDPLLIFGLDMGTAGAALATALSQLVSFVVLLIPFLRGRSIVRLRLSRISRSPKDYLLILTTGLPTIFRQGLASVASATLNVTAAAFGSDAAVAAITISNKVYLLVRNVVLGIGQAFQPVAGYNYGAKNYPRTKKAFWVATAMGSCVCCAAALLTAVFARPIISWFRDDAEVIAIGAQALRFAACVMPFMGFSTFVNQMYQCLGYKTAATFLASCRQGIFFLPIIWLLPTVMKLGLLGVELTQPLSDLLTFLISAPFLVVFFRKHLS